MSRVKNILIRAYNRVEKELLRIDQLPLWWLGLIIAAIFFLPYFILGKGCIFEINDQLDESIMNYILPARHFLDGSNVYPEMLGGVNASGMQPSAILFLPLYILYSPRIAFLLQYIICFLIAFAGMYLLVKESTQSSILAVIAGSCFCVLPLYPIYGLTEFGIPLVIYAFLCFWKRKKIHFRCAVYVVVWVDQPSGMYRVCGVRSVAPGDHHRCDPKKKEFMAAMGIWRVAVNVYDR